MHTETFHQHQPDILTASDHIAQQQNISQLFLWECEPIEITTIEELLAFWHLKVDSPAQFLKGGNIFFMTWTIFL